MTLSGYDESLENVEIGLLKTKIGIVPEWKGVYALELEFGIVAEALLYSLDLRNLRIIRFHLGEAHRNVNPEHLEAILLGNGVRVEFILKWTREPTWLSSL